MTKLSLDKAKCKFMFCKEYCIVYTCFESLNNTIKGTKTDTGYTAATMSNKTKEQIEEKEKSVKSIQNSVMFVCVYGFNTLNTAVKHEPTERKMVIVNYHDINVLYTVHSNEYEFQKKK